MAFLYFLVLFIFIFLSIILCFVILMQESKSMGLGASFGGDSGDSLFGTGTAVVLKKFTAYLAAIFMILCVVLSFWSPFVGKSKIQKSKPAIEEVED